MYIFIIFIIFIRAIFGEETFLSSIRTYLIEFSLESVFSNDLLAVLEREAKSAGDLDDNVDLQAFMDSWLTR